MAIRNFRGSWLKLSSSQNFIQAAEVKQEPCQWAFETNKTLVTKIEYFDFILSPFTLICYVFYSDCVTLMKIQPNLDVINVWCLRCNNLKMRNTVQNNFD